MFNSNSHTPSCQAATLDNNLSHKPFNLTDPLFESFSAKIKPCNMFDLNLHVYDFDSNASFLIIHLNICSLQAHFDDFNLFLHKFSHPLSIIFLSEIRININPIININIPGYLFVHFPSPTKAGGVSAYVAKNLKFSENEHYRLHVSDCEDIWLDVELPGIKNKYTFAVIYRHPQNNYKDFLDSLDDKLQLLNRNNYRFMLMGDFNIDVNTNVTPTRDYLYMLQSNACINLITKPTRVTS